MCVDVQAEVLRLNSQICCFEPNEFVVDKKLCGAKRGLDAEVVELRQVQTRHIHELAVTRRSKAVVVEDIGQDGVLGEIAQQLEIHLVTFQRDCDWIDAEKESPADEPR